MSFEKPERPMNTQEQVFRNKSGSVDVHLPNLAVTLTFRKDQDGTIKLVGRSPRDDNAYVNQTTFDRARGLAQAELEKEAKDAA